MKNRLPLIALLGFGHGLNDFIAGYFMGSFVQLKIDVLQIGLGLFIYNLLAFGGQYPFALLLEKYNKPRKFLVAAYSLNLGAVACFIFLPGLSIVLAGFASAAYHVTGGTLSSEKNKAFNIGLFAAPGVAGLVTGGYFAWAQISVMPLLMTATIIFLMILLWLPVSSGKNMSIVQKRKEKTVIDDHDILMILLLTFISFRSMIWNVFQLIHKHEYDWLVAIAASAFAGKIIGGWIADKIGWRIYSFVSLLFAMPLLTIFKKELLLFTIGIGLLQSSIPATTSLLIKTMKGKRERAIGLSFGTTIMAGAIVFYSPARNFFISNWVLWIMSAVMILTLIILKKKHRALQQ
ncbi:MAG: MFS transporter [Chitinophagales bacterium]